MFTVSPLSLTPQQIRSIFWALSEAYENDLERSFHPEYNEHLKTAPPGALILLYEKLRQSLNKTVWSEFPVEERLGLIAGSYYEFLVAIASSPHKDISDADLLKATCTMLENCESEDEMNAIVLFALQSFGRTKEALVQMAVALGCWNNHAIALRHGLAIWRSEELVEAIEQSKEAAEVEMQGEFKACLEQQFTKA